MQHALKLLSCFCQYIVSIGGQAIFVRGIFTARPLESPWAATGHVIDRSRASMYIYEPFSVVTL
jgi:hypothetical protein